MRDGHHYGEALQYLLQFALLIDELTSALEF